MIDLPADFKTKYQQLLDAEYDDFLTSYEQPVVKAFRINPLKNNQTLFDTTATGQVPWGQWGYYGAVAGHSVDHTTGLIYSQEPSAQLVAEVANPQPGDKVLDLAAAPGGKTTHLASLMKGEGLLVSNEIFRKRAQILSENVERFGLANVLVTNHAPAELEKTFGFFFDKIVLDAPCSGEGMFRKDPAAMQYWHADYPAENAARDREILASVMKMLKPGGELTYSTCTFAPEEDEQIIAWLVATYPEMEIIPIEKPDGVDDGRPEWADGNSALNMTARLFPHHLQGEGHFIAKLRRRVTDADETVKAPKLQKNQVTKEQAELWEAFRSQELPSYQPETLVAFGDQLYALPAGTPEIKGLQIMRAGLHLGTLKKKRFEPSLALALALKPEQFAHRYELTLEEWQKYVHGDTFFVPSEFTGAKGWYLLEINGNGAGFGKLVDRQMKNFYPKGLRFQVRTNTVDLADDMY